MERVTVNTSRPGRAIRALIIAGAAAAPGACSDGPGDSRIAAPPPPPPPAAVAGTWEAGYTDTNDPGPGTLSGCSGDLAEAEGTSSLPMGIDCDIEGPVRVTQTDADFVIEPIRCAGTADTEASGSGTVSGNMLEGQLDVEGGGETRSLRFTGEVDGAQLTLTANRITVSGGRSGACDIDPPSEATVMIIPD